MCDFGSNVRCRLCSAVRPFWVKKSKRRSIDLVIHCTRDPRHTRGWAASVEIRIKTNISMVKISRVRN